MRVIYRAALVFLLRDIYTKMPVTNASILCNGKQNPYTRKKSGHYVFSNLYPGKYDISITCKGYNSLNFSVEVRENETKEMNFDLSYSIENQSIMNISRLEIACTHKNEVLADTEVRLKFKNNLSFLKLIEPISAGGDELKTNIERITNLLGQNYAYEVGKKQYDFFFWSYDQEKKAYILRDNVSEKIDEGGKFYAFWDLKTDSKGRLIMPILSQFMKDDILKFELTTSELRANVEADITGKHDSGEVIYLDANFRKIPKKKA